MKTVPPRLIRYDSKEMTRILSAALASLVLGARRDPDHPLQRCSAAAHAAGVMRRAPITRGEPRSPLPRPAAKRRRYDCVRPASSEARAAWARRRWSSIAALAASGSRARTAW